MTSEMQALHAAVMSKRQEANEIGPSAVQSDLRRVNKRGEVRAYDAVLQLINESVKATDGEELVA